MALKQSIPLTGIRNSRELGGYVTADGRVIKKGVLLRTAGLNGMSDEDFRLLKDEYRLQHIIDLRMKMELLGADDPTIDGAEYHHLDIIDITEMLPEGAPAIEFDMLDRVKVVELAVRSGMLNEDMYIGFLRCGSGKKAFSDFFKILLASDPDRAVLWHCTSGKDRTGLAAMLLLSALGADEKTIFEDYLLTNEYNAKRIESTRQFYISKGYDKAFTDTAVLVFDAVDGQFMKNAIEYLKKEYGSVTGYIRDGLGISQEDIDSLKEKYLVQQEKSTKSKEE